MFLRHVYDEAFTKFSLYGWKRTFYVYNTVRDMLVKTLYCFEIIYFDRKAL